MAAFKEWAIHPCRPQDNILVGLNLVTDATFKTVTRVTFVLTRIDMLYAKDWCRGDEERGWQAQLEGHWIEGPS